MTTNSKIQISQPLAKFTAPFGAALLLALTPMSAHAFNLLDGPGSMFTGLLNGLILQVTTLFMMLAIAFLTVMVVAIPIVADFALVLGALFMPVALAVWPLTKTWTTAAFGTIVSSAMTGTAAAFFISLLLKDGGAMSLAIDKANKAMVGLNGTETIGPVMGASIGMIIFSLISIMAAMSITGVVAKIFGGASIDGAKMAAGGMMAAAGGAAGASSKVAGMSEGGAKGAKAAAAANKESGAKGFAAAGNVLRGAASGAAAAGRSRNREAMLSRIGGATKAIGGSAKAKKD